MFLEGWGSPECPQIGPKIDFRCSMGHFGLPLDRYGFKVALKSAFLEKDRDQAE